MIFFPQLPVFIRQVGDSVHHYDITLWYSFLSSLYLSGKSVTPFIIMVLLTLWYSFLSGKRGGSVVECRTPEREVRGSKPTAAVLCPWARHFTPRKYWLITQEAMAPSRYDWKIVDWDVKPQHNQPTNFPQFSAFIMQIEDSIHHYDITLWYFFPQFSVFIRQVGDCIHHYGITFFIYFFLSSMYLSGKLVTQFNIMVLLTL